ncbi:hypothetical protein J42TS3_27480 [Paenibacillus vini]|uniref:SnoaL-like domain-containing protein n=1 Tax=Paenibacillus vini TaxID=1476024 RepID=A0ABQ4MCJ2_9BACL|nr:hypothetical protein J42TS3_27480 [Paenibacillus vini]
MAELHKFSSEIFHESSLEEHHGQVKFSWYFGPSDNPQTISGHDFIVIENGLILGVFIEKSE